MERNENYKRRFRIFYRVVRSVNTVAGRLVCRHPVISETLSRSKGLHQKVLDMVHLGLKSVESTLHLVVIRCNVIKHHMTVVHEFYTFDVLM